MLDGVQRLLFALKPNDVWVGDHLLCKPPHRILKRCREKKHLTAFCPPMDTNTLVPMTLCGDHHIRLVQHKHCDLLGVNELVLGAPVQNFHYNYGLVLTSVASNGVCQLHVWTKFAHLLDDLTSLESELIRWQDAQTLKEANS
uniref:Uncharacterized protein n=1 Tax=Echeneis naucrates TaxID=173247 RepID=A0A665USK7_ECHNA